MKTRYQVLIAILATVGIFSVAVFIAEFNSEEVRVDVPNLSSDSSIVTADASKTASLFIEANGTIGDLELVSSENIRDFDSIRDNINIRTRALEKVKEAIVPGSPLINGREENNIKEFSNNTEYPTLFKVSNVRVGKENNERTLTSYSEVGPTSYEGVDVNVEFESTMMTFTSPRDTTYDGTYERVDNKEHFDVKVTLAKSGDLWFVYDIENSESELSQRFATWSGNSKSHSDNSKDEIIGEITTNFNVEQ